MMVAIAWIVLTFCVAFVSVFETKGLDLSAESVLQNHKECPSNTRTRITSAPVLGYVTPWNSKGYDIAEQLNTKFTHISPVWLQLHWDAASSHFVVAGQHDIDAGWMKRVAAPQAQGSARVKIVPRILFELDQTGSMQLLSKPKLVPKVLAEVCRKHNFDGLVVETWSQWAGSGLLRHPSLRQQAFQALQLLADKLHASRPSLELILAVPPFQAAHQGPSFAVADFQELRSFVDYFSVMTYDASHPGRPGPNAPWNWVKSNAEAVVSASHKRKSSETEQVLLGLNWYGNDYKVPNDGGPIVGHQYLHLLEKYKPTLFWDKKSKEHVFEYSTGHEAHEVYYPTQESIQKRLDLAHKHGLGISIWELGQGLVYFYELL